MVEDATDGPGFSLNDITEMLEFFLPPAQEKWHSILADRRKRSLLFVALHEYLEAERLKKIAMAGVPGKEYDWFNSKRLNARRDSIKLERELKKKVKEKENPKKRSKIEPLEWGVLRDECFDIFGEATSLQIAITTLKVKLDTRFEDHPLDQKAVSQCVSVLTNIADTFYALPEGKFLKRPTNWTLLNLAQKLLNLTVVKEHAKPMYIIVRLYFDGLTVDEMREWSGGNIPEWTEKTLEETLAKRCTIFDDLKPADPRQ